ncbi:hypothetical protein [Paracoccus sanguinis]|uniref:Uncharacterized protein n=1 Tax=Paracoccus sanguinis TaxID=1545044 RepID=A0A1H3CB02_9RHOB|nr:hypothetical protein [Paracoccus sanguinis]KGJ18546.1 hypothetical protein IX57_03840 [Paracoccus sanguinis]SDX51291.1 hypothetical protein SAMN05444276_10833 [Paracoccus sanguinis]
MIPDAYELKRIVRAHRDRFWMPDLLDGFEFAPVWRFADQERFDSDEVDALARRLAAGPQRLPHPDTIFELRDRGPKIRSQIVYARQRPDGIEALWLSLWRSPRRWTDVHAYVWIADGGVAEFAANPALEDVEMAEQCGQAAAAIVWRGLAILSQAADFRERQVPSTRRKPFARAGVQGWVWRQVAIDPARLRAATPPQGGSHASPRWHIRRGHWRQLADGRRVFVRQCEVGDPTRGGIVKDYAVEARQP